MADYTVTRTHIAEAIKQEIGLSKSECADILEQTLSAITDHLNVDSPVKIVNFGSFSVRLKKQRLGRNPRTLEEVIIPPLKVIKFLPARNLKHLIEETE